MWYNTLQGHTLERTQKYINYNGTLIIEIPDLHLAFHFF